MYRRYFGLTPPNPGLCNPRLLEDYIDWYMNVYLEEELPWDWVRMATMIVNVNHMTCLLFHRSMLAVVVQELGEIEKNWRKKQDDWPRLRRHQRRTDQCRRQSRKTLLLLLFLFPCIYFV